MTSEQVDTLVTTAILAAGLRGQTLEQYLADVKDRLEAIRLAWPSRPRGSPWPAD